MQQPPFSIPEYYAASTIQMRGAAGQEWIARLPQLLRDYAQKWEITVEPPFPNLSFNYVAPAERKDGTKAVLKAGFTTDKEFKTELQALRIFDGHGIVKLLEYDLAQSMMLLERLEPGTPLTAITNDEEATTIAASVMRELWQSAPASHQFPYVSDWGKGFSRLRARFEGKSGPFPAKLVDKAERLFAELAASQSEQALLHGDLHHDNILKAQREPWLIIDPKGIIGEPVYETGALLRNPQSQLLHYSNPRQVLARRVALLSEHLGMDRERILGWGFSQAVLSAWWFIEDNGQGWEQEIACAELLNAL